MYNISMETPMSSPKPRCQSCGRHEVRPDGRCICGHLQWPYKPPQPPAPATPPEKPEDIQGEA